MILDTTFRAENIGNADLHISSVNIFYKAGDPYTGWIDYSPSLTTIPYSDPNYVDVTLSLGVSINPTGAVGLTGGLEFISDSPMSPDTLPIFLIVADTVQQPEYAVIHTDCQPLVLNNAGQLGADIRNNNAGANMNFYNDCDTTNNIQGGDDNSTTYLYEASPFILRVTQSNDTILNSYIFDANWLRNDGFRPQEGLTVDSTSDASVMVFKTGRFATSDSLIFLESEMYAPQHPDSCEFWVQKLYVYQNQFLNPTSELTGLFIGELMDWDIPSDSGVENGSDFDVARQMMYCFGAEYGTDDIPNNDCILADDRMGGLAYYAGYRVPHTHPVAYNVDSFPIIRGMWTGTNANWITPTGNWIPQVLYDKMYTFGGFETWEATNPFLEDSMYQDLNMVSIFGQFDLGVNDTLVFVKIFSTTQTGISDLLLSIDKARNWIEEHDLFNWPPLVQGEGNCCEQWGVPGDANMSGYVDLLDIIAMVNYFVYDYAPSGACLELYDADGSSAFDILDIARLLKYIYGSGEQPPVCPPDKSAGMGEEVTQ